MGFAARLVRAMPAAALVAVGLALPAAALATEGTGSGRAWPRGAIRVFNAAGADQRAVELAIAGWNGAGARVRFVQVTRRARAQVVVRYDPHLPACGMGFGSIGYPGPGIAAEVLIRKGTALDGQSCAWPGQTLVVAHELGHVLGFQHVNGRCSVMNPSISMGRGPKLCVPIPTGPDDAYIGLDSFGRWRCDFLEASDVTRLVGRYGGSAKPRRADPWCDVYAPIAPPQLTAARVDVEDGAGGTRAAVRVELVRAAEPALPPFIAQDPSLAAQSLRNRYLLYRSTGACLTARPGHPYRPPDGTTLVTQGNWTAAVGATEVVVDTGGGVAGAPGPLAGPVCYTAWAVDVAARPSREFSQAALVV